MNPEPSTALPSRGPRITSIDALRGLVMFTMIFVNDLAGVPKAIVPWWMRHFPGRGNGMTFVDLVFPAFLFLVGMSIPFALGSRLEKGASIGHRLPHVLVRTLSLLVIGIMMVNETPDTAHMGWSGTSWSVLMYLSAILAFCVVSPPREADGGGPASPAAGASNFWKILTVTLRILGFGGLLFLALAFRGSEGHRIISFAPFSIHAEWYGILGLIGWAYLVGSAVFLVFRLQRTALLGCVALLLCLFAADRLHAFDGFWLAGIVGIGETLGSQASITVAGMLLASILMTPDSISTPARVRFTLWFTAGFAAAALLLHPLYGINKNSATPSWCLWACAITATLWLILYMLCDVRGGAANGSSLPRAGRLLALAGQNVLLAYLLSEMLPSLITLLGLDGWYSGIAASNLALAVARSAACGAVVLAVSMALNRFGFRLRL